MREYEKNNEIWGVGDGVHAADADAVRLCGGRGAAPSHRRNGTDGGNKRGRQDGARRRATGARAHRGGKGHAGGALHYGSRL